MEGEVGDVVVKLLGQFERKEFFERNGISFDSNQICSASEFLLR